MITSIANPQIKMLMQLKQKARLREQRGVFLAEGRKMLSEAPEKLIEKVYVSESFLTKEGKKILSDYSCEILSDKVFSHISDTCTPQGVLCVLKRPEYTLDKMISMPTPLLIILENIQDPGNLGTIMRTAEGAGATGVILSRDCVDIFNPKTIRATMGSIYRVPFIYRDSLADSIAKLKEHNISVYAAHLQGKMYYDQISFEVGTAFLIGNEGQGLREETARMADNYVKIPMEGKLESLNAAIACAILLFEASRQRR